MWICALSSAIQRYPALSRAISHHLAPSRAIWAVSKSNIFFACGWRLYVYEWLDTAFELSQAARHRAGCAATAKKSEVKCSDGPSEPATLDLSKCGCHGSDLERLKDKAILDVCARLPGGMSTAAGVQGVLQRDVRAMGQRCLMATFFFVSQVLSLRGTAYVSQTGRMDTVPLIQIRR